MIDTVSHKISSHSFSAISKEQCKDTGMVCALICLIVTRFLPGFDDPLIIAALVILVLDVIAPVLFKPAAWLWFGLAFIMGAIMSKVILTLLYIALVVPVGFIRIIMGKDSLYLKQWKKSGSSVFHVRDHTFTAHDIENPY